MLKKQKVQWQNFKRWKQKMFFYLTTLNLARFLKETAPQVEPPKEGQPSNAQAIQAVEAWKHSKFMCHNYVLIGLVDDLYNVLDLQVLIHEIHAERMTQKEMSVEDLIICLRIENDNKLVQKNTYAPDFAKANMVKHDGSSLKSNSKEKGKRKNKNDKNDKGKAEYLDPKAGIANMVNDNMDMIAMVSDIISMISKVNLLGFNNGGWWVDTRVTRHVCADKSMFHSFRAVDSGEKLYMGNSITADIKGEGDVIMKITSEKELKLTNVLYVLEIRKNLVSGWLLNKFGFCLIFESDKFVLSKNQMYVGKGYALNAKLTRSSFKLVKRKTEPLDMIHTDICDLKSLPTKGGNKYFITFIDDCTKDCYVYLLKSKDEAIDMFVLCKTKVENQLGRKIKVVRSDRGGESVSPFAKLCAKHGIKHEFTASYSPQQNGIDERKNCTLKEMETESSSRLDNEVVQDKRQQDDNDLHDERQDQLEEEEVEPRKSKMARAEKLFGPDFFSFMELVDLPPGCKPLGYKWIFKKKIKATIDKYKERLQRQMIKSTKDMLKLKFDMKDIGLADVILGIKIIQTHNGLVLSQRHRCCPIRVFKNYWHVNVFDDSDLSKLIEDLKKVWIGNHHLFAAKARFDRKPAIVIRQPSKPVTQSQPPIHQRNAKPEKSYADAFYGKEDYTAQSATIMKKVPLDATDLLECFELSNVILVKVHDVHLIPNINNVLCKEGFTEFKCRYVGGLWIWVDFNNPLSAHILKQNKEMAWYFTQICFVSHNFNVDEKIVWIEITGLPLWAWTNNAFKKIASAWGEPLFVDDDPNECMAIGRVCIKTKVQGNISDNCLVTIQGKNHQIRIKEFAGWCPDMHPTSDASQNNDAIDGSENELDAMSDKCSQDDEEWEIKEHGIPMNTCPEYRNDQNPENLADGQSSQENKCSWTDEASKEENPHSISQ
nr:Pol polyprotein [Tanacetum cinerariifolium]